MSIRLSEDSEQFVHDAVRAGFYPGEDDVIRDALDRLKQSLSSVSNPPARGPEATRPAELQSGPVTPEELNRRLLASGLVTQLPDPAEDVDDAEDLPVKVLGEPISETILRERR